MKKKKKKKGTIGVLQTKIIWSVLGLRMLRNTI